MTKILLRPHNEEIEVFDENNPPPSFDMSKGEIDEVMRRHFKMDWQEIADNYLKQ
jgi:hypothetical protein